MRDHFFFFLRVITKYYPGNVFLTLCTLSSALTVHNHFQSLCLLIVRKYGCDLRCNRNLLNLACEGLRMLKVAKGDSTETEKTYMLMSTSFKMICNQCRAL